MALQGACVFVLLNSGVYRQSWILTPATYMHEIKRQEAYRPEEKSGSRVYRWKGGTAVDNQSLLSNYLVAERGCRAHYKQNQMPPSGVDAAYCHPVIPLSSSHCGAPY